MLTSNYEEISKFIEMREQNTIFSFSNTNNGAGDERLQLRYNQSNSLQMINIQSQYLDASITATALGTARGPRFSSKVALRSSAYDNITIDELGTQQLSETSNLMPDYNLMRIGFYQESGGGNFVGSNGYGAYTESLNACIKKIAIYDKVLSDSEATALTEE